jgi:2'-5' RNA ligase
LKISKRKQLTLFLQTSETALIERIRQQFNPKQFELIKAHVTLCREDEIENLDAVLANLASLKMQPITIYFDKPERFDNGKGVYLSAKNYDSFNKLRECVLKGIIDIPRNQTPHITLMHPRNSTCTDYVFEQIVKEDISLEYSFNEISLIEQINAGKWQTINQFSLTT